MPQIVGTSEISALIQDIDILEESIRHMDKKLLDILLSDKTTHKYILWATKDYEKFGAEFAEDEEICPDQVIGHWASIIQPRIAKAQEAQTSRTRDKAEVFTPSWICNKQNNLVDEQWFGRKDVFNTEDGQLWHTNPDAISFEGCKKGWKKYVDAQRLEISCGEAPYIVSRYDTVTGEKIPLFDRIGLLDRKTRVVKENTQTAEEWLDWSQRAFESVYGYEYQGDNLLLARENLLYSYIEYYYDRFETAPDIKTLRKIANIISWNIWQMDGLKYVVPGSCKPVEQEQMSLFDFFDGMTEEEPTRVCPGCAKGNIHAHTGTYCRIFDWRTKESIPFISMIKGGR